MRVDLEIMPILLRVLQKLLGVLRSSMERKNHLHTWLNYISRTVVSNYHSKNSGYICLNLCKCSF